MGWKDWSYLKKGAIVGFAISLIFFLVLVVAGLIKDWPTGDYFSFILFGIFSSFFTAVQAGIFIVLLGSLIGMIYAKIKNKK